MQTLVTGCNRSSPNYWFRIFVMNGELWYYLLKKENFVMKCIMPVISIFKVMSENRWALRLFFLFLFWHNANNCHLFPQYHYQIKVCLFGHSGTYRQQWWSTVKSDKPQIRSSVAKWLNHCIIITLIHKVGGLLKKNLEPHCTIEILNQY